VINPRVDPTTVSVSVASSELALAYDTCSGKTLAPVGATGTSPAVGTLVGTGATSP
jgi:hypothetical protein